MQMFYVTWLLYNIAVYLQYDYFMAFFSYIVIAIETDTAIISHCPISWYTNKNILYS